MVETKTDKQKMVKNAINMNDSERVMRSRWQKEGDFLAPLPSAFVPALLVVPLGCYIASAPGTPCSHQCVLGLCCARLCRRQFKRFSFV